MKELGEYDAGQHQGAADQAAHGEGFMQYYPSAQDGEDGFQAHDQGGMGGVGFFLRYELERERDSG